MTTYHEGDHVLVQGIVLIEQDDELEPVLVGFNGEPKGHMIDQQHITFSHHTFTVGDRIWNREAEQGGVIVAISPDGKSLWVERTTGVYATMRTAEADHG